MPNHMILCINEPDSGQEQMVSEMLKKKGKRKNHNYYMGFFFFLKIKIICIFLFKSGIRTEPFIKKKL